VWNEGVSDFACLAVDRDVSVFPTSECWESDNHGKHHSRNQLHVYGLQRGIAAHAGCDAWPHLFTGHQGPGGILSLHYLVKWYKQLLLSDTVSLFVGLSAGQQSQATRIHSKTK